MYIIQLPIYTAPSTKSTKVNLINFNWLLKINHFAVHAMKKKYMKMVTDALKDCYQIKGKVRMEYEVYCLKTQDYGNIRSVMEKFVLDGMKEAGLIKDDSIRYVVEDSCKGIEVPSPAECKFIVRVVPLEE